MINTKTLIDSLARELYSVAHNANMSSYDDHKDFSEKLAKSVLKNAIPEIRNAPPADIDQLLSEIRD